MITIIFDIDGTLVDSMKFDSELYIQAVKTVLGNVHIHDDWGKYRRVTDPGILLQIIEENNVPDAQKKVTEVRKYFGELMESHLKSNPCNPKKGALDAVNNLLENPDFIVGFATGGWGHTAAMKLHSADFSNGNIPLFSGDHHCERVNIMKLCKEHISPFGKNIVYVGDAPWDLKAAYELHWGFIGVGERLRSTAEVWILDYTDKNWPKSPDKAIKRMRTSEALLNQHPI
jgi:phosphoglycolate phosphatase-like HAD superfamily hydrolase